jgi:hypothetical protein
MAAALRHQLVGEEFSGRLASGGARVILDYRFSIKEKTNAPEKSNSGRFVPLPTISSGALTKQAATFLSSS